MIGERTKTMSDLIVWLMNGLNKSSLFFVCIYYTLQSFVFDYHQSIIYFYLDFLCVRRIFNRIKYSIENGYKQ
jgi:hypothetical protein